MVFLLKPHFSLCHFLPQKHAYGLGQQIPSGGVRKRVCWTLCLLAAIGVALWTIGVGRDRTKATSEGEEGGGEVDSLGSHLVV